jgi:N-acetylmuramoyl-L-alanine amidase
VALAISKLLALELEAYGITTHLTRPNDVFVTLDERCDLANTEGSHYFISIHLNSDGPEAEGIETLYASDYGKALAGPIQKALIEATGEKDRGLKYRDNLWVLNGTRMPAVLVEVGFISHPVFEAKFRTTDYQGLLAKAISRGVLKHLNFESA